MSAEQSVFFYGLFMDSDLLRAKGLRPGLARIGYIDGYALGLGARAYVKPSPGGRVYGTVMSLGPDDRIRLYAEPSVSDYRPMEVVVHLPGEGAVRAVTYNLPEAPSAGTPNPSYAERLREVAGRLGLPTEYVASIR